MRLLTIGFGLAAALLYGRGVGATEPRECGDSGRPWVRIPAEELPASLGDFVSLLRAELASRGFELCTSDPSGGPPPLATVRVSSGPDAVALTVDVRDAVTEKQVRRDVALGGIPADGQPLTLALAADELLRASWAELTLRTAPLPTRPVPPQVVQTCGEATLPVPELSPSAQFGVGFVWEQYSHGMALYGVDGHLGGWLTRRFELALQFGLRKGPTDATTDGTAQPSAWSLGTAALWTFTRPEGRWGLDGVANLGVERLTFVPTPVVGATDPKRAATRSSGVLGPRAGLRSFPRFASASRSWGPFHCEAWMSSTGAPGSRV